MKFLGGFLVFLSVLLMLGGAVGGTLLVALGITEEMIEPILVGAAAFLGCLCVALGVLSTGMALRQLVKMKKRVERLEQQLFYAPAASRPVTEAPAAPVAPMEASPVAESPVIPANPLPAEASKKRKVWIPIVIVAVLLVIGVLAVLILPKEHTISSEDPTVAPTEAPTMAVPETDAPAEVCPITVNGFFVDDSYKDEDGQPLKLVYMFYTMTAESSNLQIDSKYTKMYIGGNMYESDHFASVAAACAYTRNYRYTSYIQDVYVGDSVNIVATFYIPEGDLEGGKTVTLEDTQIPGAETLSFTTDEFLHFGTPEEIAMFADPEGYEQTIYLWSDADNERTQEVRSHLNGYTWNFYVNNLAYELSFWANNNFSVRTAFTNQTGTYTVQNGYVFCTYPDTGYTIKIPYELNNGDFDLDTIKGFDVMSN